jgi:hypothetical protein
MWAAAVVGAGWSRVTPGSGQGALDRAQEVPEAPGRCSRTGSGSSRARSGCSSDLGSRPDLKSGCTLAWVRTLEFSRMF